jgi:hypothetical protein
VPVRPPVEEIAVAAPEPPPSESPRVAVARAPRPAAAWLISSALLAALGLAWAGYHYLGSPPQAIGLLAEATSREVPVRPTPALPTPSVDSLAEEMSSVPPAVATPPPPRAAVSSVASVAAPSASAEPLTLSAEPSDARVSPPENPATLLSYEGYLRINSSADHFVFVTGVKAGRTNTWLRVPCGLKFVRLGEAVGQWTSEGYTVNVGCRGAAEVAIEPASP